MSSTTTVPIATYLAPAPSPANIRVDLKPRDNIPFVGNDVSGSFVYYLKQGTEILFNASILNIVFWLVTLYIIVYFITAIFAPRSSYGVEQSQIQYSRNVDLVLLAIIGLGLAYFYNTLPEHDKNNLTGFTIKFTYEFFNNPWGLVESIVFTFVFFLMVFILKVPMTHDAKPVLVHLLEHKIWIIFATYIVCYFFKYVLNIPILDILLNNSVTQSIIKSPMSAQHSPSTETTSVMEYITKFINKIKCFFTRDASCNAPAPASSKPKSTFILNAPSPASSGVVYSSPSVMCKTIVTPSPFNEVFNVEENKYT
jgi:hypothetical protein